jgi:hypothetical protein
MYLFYTEKEHEEKAVQQTYSDDGDLAKQKQQ